MCRSCKLPVNYTLTTNDSMIRALIQINTADKDTKSRRYYTSDGDFSGFLEASCLKNGRLGWKPTATLTINR